MSKEEMPTKSNPKEIGPKEIEKFQAAEELTEEAWIEKRRLGSLKKRLSELGVTEDIINTLGVEGVCAILTETEAEEIKAYLESKKVLISSLEKKLQDPVVKTMAEFRLKNLKEAFHQDYKIEKEKEKSWQKMEESLRETPSETLIIEYNSKLKELKPQLEELKAKKKLSADESNQLKKIEASIQLIDVQLKRKEKPEREMTLEKREIIGKHQEKLKELDGKEEELRQSNPEAFLGLYHRDFRHYTRSLTKNQLVETPYVKKNIDEICSHFRSDIPVMIYGHFGSGKTELAMQIARTRFKKTVEDEKKGVPDSYIISGSKHIVPAEFYGHQVLAVPEMAALEKTGGFSEEQRKKWQVQQQEVEEEYKKWLQENQKASEEEKNRAHQRFLTLYCAQLGKGTISDFILGPVYKAMEEGRPLIIDEINAIPHEVLISLNYILTRKAGEIITVQQDTGKTIKIKKGFCIMMTGNLNQGQSQYVHRAEMDPAFLSRLHRVEYDYLPQTKEGKLEDKRGTKNEQYQLLLAKLADRSGNIIAPEKILKDLWRLAQAARILQDVFAGRQVESAYYYQEAGGKATAYMLKKSALTLRELGRILDVWKGDNFQKELDYYLYNDFVKEATDLNDRAYLYQTLQKIYGFFKTPGWEQNPSYGTAGQVTSFKIESPENLAGELKFFGPKEIVEAAFGKIPERKKWPEITLKEKTGGKLMRKILVRREEITENIRNLKKQIPKELAKDLPAEI